MENYDPAKVYGSGQNVPRHGGHRKPNSKRKKKDILPIRGVAVANTGKIPASSDRTKKRIAA